MPDEPKDPRDRPPDEQLDELQQSASTGDLSSKDRLRKTTHIALLMSYDLIDKLRYYEKETAKLTPAEIEKRLPHMAGFLDQLKIAYLQFSDLDDL